MGENEYWAVKVSQPFGDFFILSLSAQTLLNVCFSDTLRITEDQDTRGSQRKIDSSRLKEIGSYIDSNNLAFPNSIIIAANFNDNGYAIGEDEKGFWKLEAKDEKGLWKISIPSGHKSAAVIDGQHRLFGFEYTNSKRRQSTELLVAVYFELPASYQAYLFALINYNQKSVSRSLAFECFGRLSGELDRDFWPPELVGVRLARELNTDEESFFHKHIKMAPANAHLLLENDNAWMVSTSTIVDGFMRLFSKNPRKDNIFLSRDNSEGRGSLKVINDNSVLRKFYLDGYDRFIYVVVKNYFTAVEEVLFHGSEATRNEVLRKTIGIQALFEVLGKILEKQILSKEEIKDVSVDHFTRELGNLRHCFFTDREFRNASGAGKALIRDVLCVQLNLKALDDVTESRREDVRSFILSPSGT